MSAKRNETTTEVLLADTVSLTDLMQWMLPQVDVEDVDVEVVSEARYLPLPE